MRTHLSVPEDLVEAVDSLVGQRRRSEFFVQAAREKVAKIRLGKAARKAAGSLADVDVPGWETRESSSAWVRASRQADGERQGRVSTRA